MFSPRMWRWSCLDWKLSAWRSVFSTYVEVIPNNLIFICSLSSFLHVCGGDPVIKDDAGFSPAFSPRMWRWSWINQSFYQLLYVFSTYVEVIPRLVSSSIDVDSFLHVCGGDPQMLFLPQCKSLFSPRMWRWSSDCVAYSTAWFVFSTYVEVILLQDTSYWFGICFLHVCGGDPINVFIITISRKFSPRMWRWSWKKQKNWLS